MANKYSSKFDSTEELRSPESEEQSTTLADGKDDDAESCK
jgi:hypothetical protein